MSPSDFNLRCENKNIMINSERSELLDVVVCCLSVAASSLSTLAMRAPVSIQYRGREARSQISVPRHSSIVPVLPVEYGRFPQQDLRFRKQKD